MAGVERTGPASKPSSRVANKCAVGEIRAEFAAADGAVASGQMAVDELVHLRRTLDGNDIDAWDPDYIRRVLPLWRAAMATYFRGEVRGLDNIPGSGPALLVGNHSGGTMTADTFVFATAFYTKLVPTGAFISSRRTSPLACRRRGSAAGGRSLPRMRTPVRRLTEARPCSFTLAGITRCAGRHGTQTGSSLVAARDSSS